VTQSGHLGSLKATHFVGVFANYENLNSSSYNVMPGGNAALGGLTATTYGHHLNAGARAREEVQLGEKWTGIVGVGVERTGLNALNTGYGYPANATPSTTLIQADRTIANVAPEAAVFYRPAAGVQLRAGVGTGYGTPQVTNLFVTPDGLNGNNTTLESQRNVGFDFGGDLRLGAVLTTSVASYYEAYRNELVTQSPGVNLLSYTFNAPKSVHRGVEVTADLRLAPGVVPGAHLLLSYTWMDQHYDEYVERLSAGNQSTAFDRAGNQIPGVTPNYVNARFAYDQPTGPIKGVGAYLELNYRDAAFMDNANLILAPSYTLWNLNLHYDPSNGSTERGRVHLLLEVRNLTNQVYVASASNLSDSISATTGLQNPASTLAASGGIWAGAPRSVVAGVRVKF
jgi:iron complex outermembrane receptor protein